MVEFYRETTKRLRIPRQRLTFVLRQAILPCRGAGKNLQMESHSGEAFPSEHTGGHPNLLRGTLRLGKAKVQLAIRLGDAFPLLWVQIGQDAKLGSSVADPSPICK